MLTKTIAARACLVRLRAEKPFKNSPLPLQRGVTLIELMVGMALGLLVVATAMGSLMLSRGISGTVSDASNIQQQGAYALRVIGQQMRQAGSMRLNLSPGTATAGDPFIAPVAIEKSAPSRDTGANAFDPSTDTIKEDGGKLSIGYRRYAEPSFSNASSEVYAMRNCVGAPTDASKDERIENIFEFNATTNELRCSGNSAAAQPLINNVAQFQVRYIIQDNSAGPSKINITNAAGVGRWGRVQAVEVCMVLYGNETVDMPDGSSYTDCAGNTVNMTTLSGARARRMHLLFRNVFQLRSQGLVEPT